jgi:RNA-directed DNA polymerase
MRRGFAKVSDLALTNRHKSLKELALPFNLFLRGHYAYYGLGGNQASLHKIRRHTEKCWHRALNKRCWKGKLDWNQFQKIKTSYLLQRPKLSIPYMSMQQYAVL